MILSLAFFFGFSLFIGNCNAACENPIHSCDNDANVVIINVGGVPQKLICPEKKECNYYSFLGTCDPCVPKYDDCTNLYFCIGEKVLLNGEEFLCPDGQICNRSEKPCYPCIPKPCANKDEYSCDKNIKNVVYDAQNLVHQCPNGYVCNETKSQPCAWCISKNTNENIRVYHQRVYNNSTMY